MPVDCDSSGTDYIGAPCRRTIMRRTSPPRLEKWLRQNGLRNKSSDLSRLRKTAGWTSLPDSKNGGSHRLRVKSSVLRVSERRGHPGRTSKNLSASAAKLTAIRKIYANLLATSIYLSKLASFSHPLASVGTNGDTQQGRRPRRKAKSRLPRWAACYGGHIACQLLAPSPV